MDLFELYQKLDRHLDVSKTWPAASKIEIILGAILVQNTNWKNVELSLERLNLRTGFDPDSLLALDSLELEDLIRPSGFFTNKGKCIREVLKWLSRYDFDFDGIVLRFGTDLRKELLKLRGIGDETADVLLLYVFEQKVFISDKYAQKLLVKLGVDGCDTYKKTAKRIRLSEDFSVSQAQDFHLLIIEFGKLYLNRGKDWEASFLADEKLELKGGTACL